MRTSLTFASTLAALAAAMACTAAYAQAAPAPTRGELLYNAHCIACHTTQVHWRSGRLATDWASLKKQVRRWQAASALQWSEADITEVARYLNDTTYRFEHDTVALR